MMQEFGELRKAFWGRHLWARGYFVASTGNVTEEMVAEYIERQGQQEIENGAEGFSVEE
jgi:putative transposase